MRWIVGAFFVVAFAGLANTSHAVAPGAVTSSIESAREATSVTQEVARRRPHHRRAVRHRRVIAR
jgi:hypothetical protein